MSAECHIHGTDLLYSEGGNADYCPSCELAKCRSQLRDRETATRELLNALAGYRTWDGPNKRQLRRLDAACDHLLDLLGDE